MTVRQVNGTWTTFTLQEDLVTLDEKRMGTL